MTVYDSTPYIPWDFLKNYGYKPSDYIFLTLETTGLSKQRSHVYLIGATFFEEDHWILRQWFCNNPLDEKDVLQDLASLLKKKKLLIHFNGKSFHIPYLNYRYQYYQLEKPSFDSMIQIDLYQKLLPFKTVLNMEHMRQIDLEKRIHMNRSQDYSMDDLIEFYQHVLETGEQVWMDPLLLHNRENMAGLLGILPLLILSDLFSGKLSSFVHCDFSSSDNVRLKIFLTDALPLSFSWDAPLYHMDFSSDCCMLTVPLYRGTLKYFFPDYKNYYYLPIEDEVIHKSLGIYVDSQHREQAKASNCYKKSKGIFLPQCTKLFTPVFQETYKGKKMWFSLKENPLTDPEIAGQYTTHLLLHSGISVK